MEEKKESSITTIYEHIVGTKNPMFYLQQGIRAILKCLGFESCKPGESSSSSESSSSMSDHDTKKEEEEKDIKEDQSDEQQKCVFQDDDPQGKQQQSEADDPPQSQTPIIEAVTRMRGRPPPSPGVGRGPPPQNN